MTGKTNTGGGTSLNFDVKAYATEAELLAATPGENTIGIVTTTAISAWVFSATSPEAPEEGMVWIATGSTSTSEFNALKKNAVEVYPLSASQYVGGTWVDVTAMSYQGGVWNSWGTYYYNNGDECEANGGIWTNTGYSRSGYTLKAPTKYESYMLVQGNGNSTVNGFAGKEKAINLTGKGIITAVIDNIGGATGYMLVLKSKSFSSPTNAAAYVQIPTASGERTAVLDVGNLEGDCYLAFMTGISNSTGFKVLEVLSQ